MNDLLWAWNWLVKFISRKDKSSTKKIIVSIQEMKFERTDRTDKLKKIISTWLENGITDEDGKEALYFFLLNVDVNFLQDVFSEKKLLEKMAAIFNEEQRKQITKRMEVERIFSQDFTWRVQLYLESLEAGRNFTDNKEEG